MNLLSQIESQAKELDEITSKNTDFVKEKVVGPADEGIEACKKAIEAFEDIKGAGFKLQLLLRRENPEKDEKGTDVNWPLNIPKQSLDAGGQSDVLQAQNKLFAKQKELREARDISRGSRPKSNSVFASITRSDWQKKLDDIEKLRKEAADLQEELDKLDEDERLASITGGSGSGDNATDDMVARALSNLDGDDTMETTTYVVPSQRQVVVEHVATFPDDDYVARVQATAAPIEDDDDTPYQSVYASDFASKDYQTLH
jgi:hypothetical protein